MMNRVDSSIECIRSTTIMKYAFECAHDGWGVVVLVGVPNKNDAFKTFPINLLNERTLEGIPFLETTNRIQISQWPSRNT
ncbi:hypothetical protein GIB67_001893 [Kingdonia uniflora]|uniref:alcohol dehydrogenase n=1 Tax=Kingdonia uniflora TaxID=39325 RepID=A0A7J7LQR2_9MAGN|nr:hypothetical protein GIB67_001893 [Kingdonia uniflora]